MEQPHIRSVTRVVAAHRQREGAGFEVRRPFPTYDFDGVDPFLLIDEMGPADYAPGEAQGAPDHPHRGFETVTYVLDGEMEHEDSAGHHGIIGPGAVQWMTAGAGVVHSEMPSRRLREDGGRMHGFQIWVNLPARDKMMLPRYQELEAAAIPEGVSPDGLARVRVVAGEALGVQAAIATRTPMVFQHWILRPGAHADQSIPNTHNACIYVFSGSARVGEEQTLVADGHLALLGAGDTARMAVAQDDNPEAQTHLLLLAGVPLREPVARYGPFVMNTKEEIYQAFLDYQNGSMGQIQR